MLGAAALVLCSSLVMAAPESLLPPGFDDPAPAPAPAPRPTAAPVEVQRPGSTATEAPALPSAAPAEMPRGAAARPADFPSLDELEATSTAARDELFGIRHAFQCPAPAGRPVTRV